MKQLNYIPEIIEIQVSTQLPMKSLSSSAAPPRNMCPEKCDVCGGIATGYHYEVPSCNGCKTFFRRTVLSKMKFICKRGGKCASDLTKKKQHWCRACRFDRCVSSGMNPMAINSADDHSENEVVKDIIRKRCADQCSTSYELELIPPSLSSEDSRINKLIDGLLYLEYKKQKFRRCRYNPDPLEMPSSLMDLIKATNKLNLADVMEPMPNWPLETRLLLTVEERDRVIREGDFRRPEKARKNWLYFDLLSTVEYAKTFPFFNSLEESDQLVLLKNVALICYNLTQAFFSYENKSDCILHPDGTNMPRPRDDRPNQLDKKEYVLLKALLLCNSGLSDLTPHGKEIIEKERAVINKALFSLCLKQLGSQGPARYAANISIVDTLEHLTKQQRDCHVLLRITSKNNFLKGAVAELVDS